MPRYSCGSNPNRHLLGDSTLVAAKAAWFDGVQAAALLGVPERIYTATRSGSSSVFLMSKICPRLFHVSVEATRFDGIQATTLYSKAVRNAYFQQPPSIFFFLLFRSSDPNTCPRPFNVFLLSKGPDVPASKRLCCRRSSMCLFGNPQAMVTFCSDGRYARVARHPGQTTPGSFLEYSPGHDSLISKRKHPSKWSFSLKSIGTRSSSVTAGGGELELVGAGKSLAGLVTPSSSTLRCCCRACGAPLGARWDPSTCDILWYYRFLACDFRNEPSFIEFCKLQGAAREVLYHSGHIF